MPHKSRSVLPGFRSVAGNYLHLPEPHGAGAPGDGVYPDRRSHGRRVLEDDHGSTRSRILPGDIWRLVRGGAGEHRVRAAGRLGTGAVPLSRQESGGCHGGSSIRAAHRRCRHRSDDAVRIQWLGRKSPRPSGLEGLLHLDRHYGGAHLHRTAVRSSHGSAGAR